MGRKRKITGLGDAVEKVTTTLGIEPCDGCNKRKETLNILFPFNKPKNMSKEDIETFETFLNRKDQNKVSAEEVKMLSEIYARTFNIKIENCPSCGSSVINKMIQKLTKLYNYELENKD